MAMLRQLLVPTSLLLLLVARSQGTQCASSDDQCASSDDASLMQVPRSVPGRHGRGAKGRQASALQLRSKKCDPPGPVGCSKEQSSSRGGCVTCLPGTWNRDMLHEDPDYYSVAATYGRFIVATVSYWAAFFHYHMLKQKGDDYNGMPGMMKNIAVYTKMNYTQAKVDFRHHAKDILPSATIEKMVELVQGSGNEWLAFCDCKLLAMEGLPCGHNYFPDEGLDSKGRPVIDCVSDGGPAPFYSLTDLSGTMVDCGQHGGGWAGCQPNTLAVKLRDVTDTARKFAALREYGMYWTDNDDFYADYPFIRDTNKSLNLTRSRDGKTALKQFNNKLSACAEDFTLEDLTWHKDQKKFITHPPKHVGHTTLKNSLANTTNTISSSLKYVDVWSQEWKLGITVGASITTKYEMTEGFEFIFGATEGVEMNFHVDVSGEFGRSESHSNEQDYDFSCIAPPSSDILCEYAVFEGDATMSFEYNLSLGSAWWYQHGVWNGVMTSQVTSKFCNLNETVGSHCP